MTVMDPSGGAPVAPGSYQWNQLHAQRRSELGTPMPVPEQEQGTSEQPSSLAASYYGSLTPQPTPAPQPAAAPRKPFNWRLTGRILLGLAIMWTVGFVLDATIVHKNPSDPLMYAVGAGVLSWLAFAAARRQGR
jgi:hypothetical protein